MLGQDRQGLRPRLAARGEHDAESIEVQHLLVAHKDAGIPGVTRSLEEAEALTAELVSGRSDGNVFRTRSISRPAFSISSNVALPRPVSFTPMAAFMPA